MKIIRITDAFIMYTVGSSDALLIEPSLAEIIWRYYK
jgi:hypothetical protein